MTCPTTDLLQPGHYNSAHLQTHYKHGYYTTWPLHLGHNPVTTNLLHDGHYELLQTWSLQHGHYKLATTILPQPRSLRIHLQPGRLQTHYNIFTITPLNLATTQSLCYNQATTKLANLVTTAQSYVTTNSLLKRTILSTMLAHPLAALLHCCLSISNVLLLRIYKKTE